MQYLIFALTLALLVATTFLLMSKFEKYKNTILKVLSLVLAVVFFVRYLLSGRSKLEGILGLTINNIYTSSFLCAVITILVWVSMLSHVILLLAPFFKYKVLKNYARTFSLVVVALQIIFLNPYIYASTGTYSLTWTGALMSVEVAIALCISLYYFFDCGYFKVNKKEALEMLSVLPVFLLASIPPYTLNVLFGNVGHTAVKSFELAHRLYLYLSFGFFFWIYFQFKKKEKDYSRMILLYISIATLISYCSNYTFSIFITPTSWPLHLCNTIMFVMPICLIFKLDRLFYFTMFINVIGALFAMFMPNYSDTLTVFSPSVVKFWINHIMAFAMPALTIFLKVYERPKLKQFIYSMTAFLIYFILVLVINAWFTNYKADVDFFFVNSDFIAEKLGTWAERLRDVTSTINIGDLKFVFYPIYQSLFFLVYVLLGLAMWFVYVALFNVEDFYLNLGKRARQIKEDEIILCNIYQKKEVSDCVNENSKDKLVVSGVYKKYGNNKHYAVENINFEVQAGEILGFLGPNGAGKSTIIKCIVGIQPATKGNIEVNGYDIQKQPVETKMQFGFVPDHYALYENLSGREYVNYIADLYGVSKEDRDRRIDKLIKQLNLVEAFDSPIKTYSHGMKQKITIISAFVHNPKLCILDEPLTGLDPISIFQLKECMREHARNGNIVFFSSHIIDVVEKLCDRIIILNKHHIVANVTLKELEEKNIGLEQFYLNAIGQDIEKLEKEANKKNKMTKKGKENYEGV